MMTDALQLHIQGHILSTKKKHNKTQHTTPQHKHNTLEQRLDENFSFLPSISQPGSPPGGQSVSSQSDSNLGVNPFQVKCCKEIGQSIGEDVAKEGVVDHPQQVVHARGDVITLARG